MNKVKQTNLLKYGTENPMSNMEIRNKAFQTMLKNNNVRTSKPQEEMGILLQEIYPSVQSDVVIGSFCLDFMLNINDCKIDIEYDGISYHENKIEKDKIRNEFVISQGYKILRIQGFGKVPELEELQKLIQNLVNSMDNIKIIKYI